MWYFTWMLGVAFACAFAIINALWLEHTGEINERDDQEFRDRSFRAGRR